MAGFSYEVGTAPFTLTELVHIGDSDSLPSGYTLNPNKGTYVTSKSTGLDNRTMRIEELALLKASPKTYWYDNLVASIVGTVAGVVPLFNINIIAADQAQTLLPWAKISWTNEVQSFSGYVTLENFREEYAFTPSNHSSFNPTYYSIPWGDVAKWISANLLKIGVVVGIAIISYGLFEWGVKGGFNILVIAIAAVVVIIIFLGGSIGLGGSKGLTVKGGGKRR